jgi:hypothetical protein
MTVALACSSSQPPLVAPEWNAVPVGLTDALCLRLKAEGIASGGAVAIVRTTQPIASMRAVGALAGPSPRRVNPADATAAIEKSQQTTIPVTLGASCSWIAVDPATIQQHSHQMLVEISAPMANPFRPGTAGVFVRMSLGGEHASWYWMSLIPSPGGWSVGYIEALAV